MSGKKKAPSKGVTSKGGSEKHAASSKRTKDADTSKRKAVAKVSPPPRVRSEAAMADAVHAVLHPVASHSPPITKVAIDPPAESAPPALAPAPDAPSLATLPSDVVAESAPPIDPDIAPAPSAEPDVRQADEEAVAAVQPSDITAEDVPAVEPGAAPAAPPQPDPFRPRAESKADDARPTTQALSALPDFDAISRTMTNLMEESSRLASTYYGEHPVMRPEVSDAVQTLGQVAEHWFGDPARLMQAQTALTAQFFNLWAEGARKLSAGPAEPAATVPRATDKRFSDPEWRTNPIYEMIHKGFLLGSQWMNDLVDQAEGLDDQTRDKARFYVRQITSALSPSNFVPTNPELLRETLKENGGNLVRGMKMLAEDLAAGNGQLRIRQTDTSKFAVGVNMAMSPGKVVFRNEVMELLQYAPSTPQVLARPLLIVPPWINKFYVLDLNPEKSFIRWMVEQGLTVFLISWVNPDERHSEKDFEAYMNEGILTALGEVLAITGQPDATAMGYCVGGTLLAVTLAHMAAHDDTRISSATLLTAQVDFSYAGDLKVFADEAQIRSLEAQMKEQGYLKGAQMAQAFNMLRPEELIWSYVVNNYLKGKEPQPFDLLAWNSDSTRMPAANHSFYLRNCYLENNLARGLMEIGGVRLDMKRVTVPVYNLATREDHIAPAVSVFEGCQYFGGPVRFVLSGSGHVAGVVNPPSKVKYGYTLGSEPRGSLPAWLAQAREQPGSWWLDWIEWIKGQAPATVAARVPGEGRPTLGDAPGDYVRAKA